MIFVLYYVVYRFIIRLHLKWALDALKARRFLFYSREIHNIQVFDVYIGLSTEFVLWVFILCLFVLSGTIPGMRSVYGVHNHALIFAHLDYQHLNDFCCFWFAFFCRNMRIILLSIYLPNTRRGYYLQRMISKKFRSVIGSCSMHDFRDLNYL